MELLSFVAFLAWATLSFISGAYLLIVSMWLAYKGARGGSIIMCILGAAFVILPFLTMPGLSFNDVSDRDTEQIDGR